MSHSLCNRDEENMFARYIVCCAFLFATSSATSGFGADHRVFIGTYTSGDSPAEGIYTCEFNDDTGHLSDPVLAAAAENPSFLAIHPTQDVLYAVNEVESFHGAPGGGVTAFRIDRESGTLSEWNHHPTQGGAPCHCNVDRTGRFLLVANYNGGNLAVFSLSTAGSLEAMSCLINHVGSSVNARRQNRAHAHSINLSADNRFAYAADLGMDQVRIYRFDSQEGLLVPGAPDKVSVTPGGGPRHFSIHPSGQFAYTNNELTASVTVFQRDVRTGALEQSQEISTLPTDFTGRRSTAECLVHPSGRYLYVSNRGHDSIAVFSIDPENGHLKTIAVTPTLGQEPRNFRIDPSGRWLLAENQNSNSIVVFSISSDDGTLSTVGTPVSVGRPVCLRFMPAR